MGYYRNFSFLLFINCLVVLSPYACKESKENRIDGKFDLAIGDKIDSVGNHFINGGKVLGFSIAITQGDEILYNKSFGHVDTARTNPITNDTRFLLASISKLLGATMVMKLVEEEKLSLENTLYELLPDFPNLEIAKKIKLRHLLSHTSGLHEYSRFIDSVYVKTRVPPSKKDFYKVFKENPLIFESGTNYRYNNSGFLLMGMIVERVTGNPFEREIERIINKPTGLDFKLISESTSDPKMTKYYELHGSEMIPEPHWTWIKGDGGITATAKDLALFPFRWAQGEIISDSSYRHMVAPTLLKDSIYTGYGLGVRNGIFEGEQFIGHTGGHKTPKSVMPYFKENQMTIVVMVNTDNTTSHARKIFANVALVVLDKEYPDYTNKEIEDNNLARFEGRYEQPSYNEKNIARIEVNTKDGHLYYKYGGDVVGKKMYHIREGEFWIEDWPFDRVIFDSDSNGNVRALREYYYGFYVQLRKKLKNIKDGSNP
ncbi:MAG: serine hydrolase domain-containing protein [Aurantibacter sp.]